MVTWCYDVIMISHHLININPGVLPLLSLTSKTSDELNEPVKIRLRRPTVILMGLYFPGFDECQQKSCKHEIQNFVAKQGGTPSQAESPVEEDCQHTNFINFLSYYFSKSSGEEENNGSDRIFPPQQIPGPYCLPIIGSLYKYLPLGQYCLPIIGSLYKYLPLGQFASFLLTIMQSMLPRIQTWSKQELQFIASSDRTFKLDFYVQSRIPACFKFGFD